MPPYKCEKTFHTPETDTHRRMIKDELCKRSYLYSSTEDENGYIFKNGIALAISKRELSKNGIDPFRPLPQDKRCRCSNPDADPKYKQQDLIDALVFAGSHILPDHSAACSCEGLRDYPAHDIDFIVDACQRRISNIKKVDPRHQDYF